MRIATIRFANIVAAECEKKIVFRDLEGRRCTMPGLDGNLLPTALDKADSLEDISC